jgi:hypothetical protein
MSCTEGVVDPSLHDPSLHRRAAPDEAHDTEEGTGAHLLHNCIRLRLICDTVAPLDL